MNVRLTSAVLLWVPVALAAHGQPRDPDDVVAVVLGQEITVADATGSEITGLIGDVLTRKFVEDNGIEPTDEEISSLRRREPPRPASGPVGIGKTEGGAGSDP